MHKAAVALVAWAALAVLLAGCASTADPSTAGPSTAGPSTPASPSASGPAPSAAADHHDDPETPADLYSRTRLELLAIQQQRGTRAALSVLVARIAEEPAIGGVCHAIAHELAHRAVDQAGGSARRALAQGTEVCGGGFTHGVIETVLGGSTNPARDLLRICRPENTGSCFHGVGHGVMLATGFDVDASLDLCDRAPSRLLSARCGEGVFMQLFSSEESAQHVTGTPALDVADDPDAARRQCAGTRADYAAPCWFYAPTVFLTVHPDDFAGALDWCRTAGSTSGRQLCAKGVGSRTVKYHPDDLTVGARTCRDGGRLEDACLQGMGSYWSVHHEGRVEPSDVCRHLTGPLGERCRAVV